MTEGFYDWRGWALDVDSCGGRGLLLRDSLTDVGFGCGFKMEVEG